MSPTPKSSSHLPIIDLRRQESLINRTGGRTLAPFDIVSNQPSLSSLWFSSYECWRDVISVSFSPSQLEQEQQPDSQPHFRPHTPASICEGDLVQGVYDACECMCVQVAFNEDRSLMDLKACNSASPCIRGRERRCHTPLDPPAVNLYWKSLARTYTHMHACKSAQPWRFRSRSPNPFPGVNFLRSLFTV